MLYVENHTLFIEVHAQKILKHSRLSAEIDFLYAVNSNCPITVMHHPCYHALLHGLFSRPRRQVVNQMAGWLVYLILLVQKDDLPEKGSELILYIVSHEMISAPTWEKKSLFVSKILVWVDVDATMADYHF